MSSLVDPELRELAAAAKRRRRVPTDASCTVCGGDEHLSRVADEVRCYSHLRSHDGSIELDHWAGVAILPRARIPLTGNAHRDVTELRRLLGFDDLPPVAGDPQMLLAHLILGIASLLILFGQWLADCVSAGRAGLPIAAFPVLP